MKFRIVGVSSRVSDMRKSPPDRSSNRIEDLRPLAISYLLRAHEGKKSEKSKLTTDKQAATLKSISIGLNNPVTDMRAAALLTFAD